MELIRFNIECELKDQFKEYCISRDTTMSKILIDYIYTLLSKDMGNSPAEEKKTVIYQCPYCGLDITHLSEGGRAKHIESCENNQKE